MSSSLIAKRISDTMALASDSLFDKFGLLDPVVMGSSGHTRPDTPNPMADSNMDFELPFEDLDFGDLLEVKEEPFDQEPVQMAASNGASAFMDVNNDLFEAINTNADPDPFFSMESLMDDASLDSIKSDCMWSSVNLFAQENSRKRRRDVSLTLSECAEGLLSINSLDVNMLDSLNTPTNMIGNMDDESSSVHSNESFEAGSEDEASDNEEIDVVGTDLGGSSARTRHCYRPNKVNKTCQFLEFGHKFNLLRASLYKFRQFSQFRTTLNLF